ncbi:hypothetical protein PBCVCan184_525R [Paramecium bursaria Chlorella virus Can18-4]|nr:hypothetical protein PBCVCan184_525R [Paramecium bursaria Chlorella virus Can18-4]
MDSLLLSGCALIGAALALWMGNKDVENEIKAIVKNTAEDNNLYIQNEAIDRVTSLLKRHGVYEKHEILVNSMSLLVYSRVHGQETLAGLVLPEDENTVRIGKTYIDRFVSSPSVLDYFLAGVAELEAENVRIGCVVPMQDIHELRKLLDVFYYKLN